MEKKRKLKRYTVSVDSETFAISLVTAPAIEVEAVALAKQEPQQMYFSDEDKHLLISPILIPNKDIYRTNGDMEYYLSFTEESIEAMSRKYMRQMRQKDITLQHEEPVEGVTLIETWLTADNYQDKAHFYGFDVPKGTWMGTFYVDSNDIWQQVKDGSIKGVSVEAMIGLEEDFSKINDKNDSEMNISNLDFTSMTTGEFFDELKRIIKEAFSKEEKEEEVAEDTVNVMMEETPITETVVEAPEEPIAPEVVEQPKVEEIAAPEPKEEPKVDAHLEELIKNLTAEIAALKEANNGLTEKVKEMSHEPSAKPITVNGKPNGGGDAYQQWRNTMKEMLGR